MNSLASDNQWPPAPWMGAELPPRSSAVLRDMGRWPMGREDVRSLELPLIVWEGSPWQQHVAAYSALVTFWQMHQQVATHGAPTDSAMRLVLVPPPLNHQGEPMGPEYACLRASVGSDGWYRDVPLLFDPDLVARGFHVLGAWHGLEGLDFWEVKQGQTVEEAIRACLGDVYLSKWRAHELSALPVVTHALRSRM